MSEGRTGEVWGGGTIGVLNFKYYGYSETFKRSVTTFEDILS